MTGPPDITKLPADLPRPEDDGGAAHLIGLRMPSIELEATTGGHVNFGDLPGWVVLAAYPRTGVPGKPPIDPDWDHIPGARGCTPQLLGYQALYEPFLSRGCRVFAISAQEPAYQTEMSRRLGLRFPIVSDHKFRLTAALNLPTQHIAGQRLLKRISLLIHGGRIIYVQYPVFPPDENAEVMLRALDVARQGGN